MEINTNILTHDFCDNKYTVIFTGDKFIALRYGETWRDLSGDKLILSMLQDFVYLTQQFQINSTHLDSLLLENEHLKNVIEQQQTKIEEYISSNVPLYGRSTK